MAADVVGYSHLIEADEPGTLAALKNLRQVVLKPLLTEHRGRMVKLMGDGLIAEFGSIVSAVACAAAVQKQLALHQKNVPAQNRIVLRIGVNLGDVVVEGDDLLGDGVNVAARLEQICPPGGVLISGAAYDHLSGKLECRFEDTGEQRLKNITRPIRTYRLVLDDAPSAPVASLRLPDKPAVAILPFGNMGDPDQVYFSDGITEDLITELSRFRELLVIARNSSFAFRGQSVDARDIGRMLGAGYIQPRARISGLIATTGPLRISSPFRRRSPAALWQQWQDGFWRTARLLLSGGGPRTCGPTTCFCAGNACLTYSPPGLRSKRGRCLSRLAQSARPSPVPIRA
jgi:class 3 adenylate cyclase